MNPHIDYQGGLSFSILLDEINHEEGETFFYKKSHKLPPPPFINIDSSKYVPSSITGNVGDTFFLVSRLLAWKEHEYERERDNNFNVPPRK